MNRQDIKIRAELIVFFARIKELSESGVDRRIASKRAHDEITHGLHSAEIADEMNKQTARYGR